MSIKERIVVYAISANPPTWGHADIMMRASLKFDKLFWIAGNNTQKTSLFSNKDRTDMMQYYVNYYKLDNVVIESFDGATVRYAEKVGAQFLLRGLRNSSDFQAELELSAGNRGLTKEVETICMFCKPHFATISSSIVRELAILGERIDQYVHPKIVSIIREKLTKKKLIAYLNIPT